MTAAIPAEGGGSGFVLRFVLYYVLLHLCYLLLSDAWLAEHAYFQTITAPAATVINWLDAGSGARADANFVRAPGVSLEVVRGCDGAGVLFLAWAAMLAFAASWRARLLGLGLAAAAIWALNGARVIALFFVVRARPDWFTLLHAYLIPLGMIGIVCGLFLAWVQASRPGADAGAVPS